jgi:hypothetical protein
MTAVNINSPDLLYSFQTTKDKLDIQYQNILEAISAITKTMVETTDSHECVKMVLNSEALIFRLRSLLMEERFNLNKIIAASDKDGTARLLAGQAKSRLKDITDLNSRLTELSNDAEQVQRTYWSLSYKTL